MVHRGNFINTELIKRTIILLIMMCLGNAVLAQRDNEPIYLRFPTVPPFSLTRVDDSTRYRKEDLPRKKATVIIIFSPDCDHCQEETKAITANISLFKKAQIIMASPLEHRHLKKFYEDYNISRYPNIIMGRDPSYFLGTYYNIKTFPSIFVYDKKGRFVKAFEGSAPVTHIAEYL